MMRSKPTLEDVIRMMTIDGNRDPKVHGGCPPMAWNLNDGRRVFVSLVWRDGRWQSTVAQEGAYEKRLDRFPEGA